MHCYTELQCLELATVFPVLAVNMVSQPLHAEFGGGVRSATGIRRATGCVTGISSVTCLRGFSYPSVRTGFLVPKTLTKSGKREIILMVINREGKLNNFIYTDTKQFLTPINTLLLTPCLHTNLFTPTNTSAKGTLTTNT